jgi:hypothetical protein
VEEYHTTIATLLSSAKAEASKAAKRALEEVEGLEEKLRGV